MKNRIQLYLVGLCLMTYLFADAQIGKVGINTTTPASMLHVKDSSVVFTGPATLSFSPGAPPVSGAGNRMMWYADKAGFRAGGISGTAWNKDSVGIYSSAIGYDVIAKGQGAFAGGTFSVASGDRCIALGNGAIASGYASISLGENTKSTSWASVATGLGTVASGLYSTAMGYQSLASEQVSTALGQGTIASGYASTAMGNGTKARALNSTALGHLTIADGYASIAMGENSKAIGNITCSLGFNTKAKPFASLVLGQFNDSTTISTTTWDLNDAVFIIGNGSSENSRANAMTVLKNGKTGINTTTPDAMLHVIKDTPSNGLYNSNAAAIFEGDQGSFIQLSNDKAVQTGILSGTEVTSIRTALIFTADSSIQMRTGGNLNKMTIKKDGNVGIGTTSPQKLLHISGGTGGNIYNAEADLVVEDNNHAYIQFSSPNNSASGFLSGNAVTDIRSALLFLGDSTVQIRSGGNNTNFTIDKAGNSNTTGEIRRTSTGNANMVPICYGSISPGTPPVINSGTGNFTITNPVAGQFTITITGENYSNDGYTITATPVSSSFRCVSAAASGNNLIVRIFNSAFAQVDTQIHFVVYKN